MSSVVLEREPVAVAPDRPTPGLASVFAPAGQTSAKDTSELISDLRAHTTTHDQSRDALKGRVDPATTQEIISTLISSKLPFQIATLTHILSAHLEALTRTGEGRSQHAETARDGLLQALEKMPRNSMEVVPGSWDENCWVRNYREAATGLGNSNFSAAENVVQALARLARPYDPWAEPAQQDARSEYVTDYARQAALTALGESKHPAAVAARSAALFQDETRMEEWRLKYVANYVQAREIGQPGDEFQKEQLDLLERRKTLCDTAAALISKAGDPETIAQLKKQLLEAAYLPWIGRESAGEIQLGYQQYSRWCRAVSSHISATELDGFLKRTEQDPALRDGLLAGLMWSKDTGLVAYAIANMTKESRAHEAFELRFRYRNDDSALTTPDGIKKLYTELAKLEDQAGAKQSLPGIALFEQQLAANNKDHSFELLANRFAQLDSVNLDRRAELGQLIAANLESHNSSAFRVLTSDRISVNTALGILEAAPLQGAGFARISAELGILERATAIEASQDSLMKRVIDRCERILGYTKDRDRSVESLLKSIIDSGTNSEVSGPTATTRTKIAALGVLGSSLPANRERDEYLLDLILNQPALMESARNILLTQAEQRRANSAASGTAEPTHLSRARCEKIMEGIGALTTLLSSTPERTQMDTLAALKAQLDLVDTSRGFNGPASGNRFALTLDASRPADCRTCEAISGALAQVVGYFKVGPAFDELALARNVISRSLNVLSAAGYADESACQSARTVLSLNKEPHFDSLLKRAAQLFLEEVNAEQRVDRGERIFNRAALAWY